MTLPSPVSDFRWGTGMNPTKNFMGGRNLSDAWAMAVIRCHASAGGVIAPAVVEFGAPTAGSVLEERIFEKQ